MHSQKKRARPTVSEFVCLAVSLFFVTAITIVPVKVAGVLMASGCSIAPQFVEKPLCRIIDGVNACRVP